MKIRIKRNHLIIRIDDLMLFIMFAGLNRIFWNDAATTTRTRLFISIILMGYLLLKNGLSHIKEQGVAFPYIFAIMVSGAANYGFTKDLLGTLVVCLSILDIFGITARYARRYGIEELLERAYYISAAYVLINDMSVLYVGRLTSSITSAQAAIMYFSGNKFAVAFLHMIFTSLFCCHQDDSWKENWFGRIKFVLLGIYNIFICMLMKCGTGMIGCVLIMVLCLFRKYLSRIINKPLTFVVVLIVLNYLFIGTNVVLSNPIVQNFILMIGKDLTLTGRIDIYPKLAEIIKARPLIGYGDSTQIVMRIVGYGNAQNGVFHIFIQYGFIGTIMFFYMCCKTIASIGKKRINLAYPILAYVIAMVVCSLVEICFSYNFLLAIALLNAISVYYTNSDNLEGEKQFEQY